MVEEAGIVETHHRVTWVRGGDAARFLHDLLSGDIAGLQPGQAGQSLLLAPNGRLRAILVVARTDAGFAVISEQPDHVVEDLRRFRIRVDVELEPDARPVSSMVGPAGPHVLGELGDGDRHGVVDRQGLMTVPDPAWPSRWFVAGDPSLVMAAGAQPVSPGAYEVLRVEMGEPRYGIDVDEKTIPNEAFDLDVVIDFGKGCYLGQELVERIDARGRRVRRLAGVVFTPGPLPPAGSQIVHQTASIGTLTSVVASPGHGPIGLGLLRSEAGPGSEVRAVWDDHERLGQVVGLPFFTNT